MNKKTIKGQKTPQAETLIVRDLGDEVVIYDTQDNRCHVLNPAAAVAWRQCEQTNSVEALAAAIAAETGLPAETDVAYLALEELATAGLLEASVAIPPASSGVSRRQMLMGMVGAAAILPAVLSSMITATPAMAQTPTTTTTAAPLTTTTTTTAAPEPEPTTTTVAPEPTPVSNPSTLILLGAGAAGLAAVAYRRKKGRTTK